MPRRTRETAAHARDLALAILGATNATEMDLKRFINGHIARVIEAANGNLSLAADLLGVNRRTLQRYHRRGRWRARRKRP